MTASVLLNFKKRRIKLSLVKSWQNRRIYLLLHANIATVVWRPKTISLKNTITDLKIVTDIDFYWKIRLLGVTQRCFTKISILRPSVTCGRQVTGSNNCTKVLGVFLLAIYNHLYWQILLPPPPPPPSKSGSKLVCNVNIVQIRKPQFWVLSRLCPETSTKCSCSCSWIRLF